VPGGACLVVVDRGRSGSIGVGVVGRSGGRAVGRSGGRAVGRSDIGKIGYLFCIAKIANPVS